MRFRGVLGVVLACALLALGSGGSSAARPGHVPTLPRCAQFELNVKGLGMYQWGVYVQQRKTSCSVAKRVLRTAEVGKKIVQLGRSLFIRDEGWICADPSGPIEWVCGRTRKSLSAGHVSFFDLSCLSACPRLVRPRRFSSATPEPANAYTVRVNLKGSPRIKLGAEVRFHLGHRTFRHAGSVVKITRQRKRTTVQVDIQDRFAPLRTIDCAEVRNGVRRAATYLEIFDYYTGIAPYVLSGGSIRACHFARSA